MMGTLTIRLSRARVKRLAESQGVSLNTLIQGLPIQALVGAGACTRFLARAARGDTQQALVSLDQFSQHI